MFYLRVLLMLFLFTFDGISSADDEPTTNKEKPTVTRPSPVNWYCPEGWTPFDDGQNITCLWYSSSSLNHAKAQGHCRKQGGSMVKVNTENKIKAFKETYPKFENEVWLGLKKERGYEAPFMWDGIDGLENANMSVMAPSVKDSLHYKVACVYVTGEGEWEIDECDNEYFFICEKYIECNPGYFGDKCSSQCHCLGVPCNPNSATIECRYGCHKGWMGTACDTEKQDPDVKYYCINSEEKGKYANIRIYTKGVLYRSIYGLNVDDDKSPWCEGTTFTQSNDLSLPVVITIPVKKELDDDLEIGTCAGKPLGNDTYIWTVVIRENDGILQEHDLQVTIKCNFTNAGSLIRSSSYSVSGEPTEVNKQSLDPQSLEDDVAMQVVNSYSGEAITEASLGSSVVLQIKYGLKKDSLIKGLSPYNCNAMSLDKKVVKQLIDHNGCPLPGSPVSAFSDTRNHTIHTSWFPLFAFEGEKHVVFQCSFDLCFTDVCRIGCLITPRTVKRSANQTEHFTKSTITVLGNLKDAKPIENSKNVSQDEGAQTFGGQVKTLLAYVNPITCALFLLILMMFVLMYVSFLSALRKSEHNIRKEIEHTRSYDKIYKNGYEQLVNKDFTSS